MKDILINKKTLYIGTAIIAVMAVGIVAFINWPVGSSLPGNQEVGNNTQDTTSDVPNNSAPAYVPKDGLISQVVVPIEKQADAIIDITTVGFSPQKVNIKAGQSVIWTNRDKALHWVVIGPSAQKGICDGAMDSCRGLKQGESFRATFKVGTWNYFDKLNPKFTGTVIAK